MDWFNYYGLIFMAVIMIPNIVYAVRHKDMPANNYNNKAASVFEQIGRYGCFVFMIFNIPYTYFNFWFNGALVVYLSVNSALCLAYIMFWIIMRNNNGLPKALALSVIPSCVFVFSGIISVNIPLMVFSVVFAVCHILISCKNAEKPHCEKNREKKKKKEKQEKEYNQGKSGKCGYMSVFSRAGRIFHSRVNIRRGYRQRRVSARLISKISQQKIDVHFIEHRRFLYFIIYIR